MKFSSAPNKKAREIFKTLSLEIAIPLCLAKLLKNDGLRRTSKMLHTAGYKAVYRKISIEFKEIKSLA